MTNITLTNIEKDFNKIKSEIGKISQNFIKETAKISTQHLQEVHTQIIDIYYNYEPNIYNRSYGLYKSMVPKKAYKKGKSWSSSIIITNEIMDEYYSRTNYTRKEISSENILDMVWYKGVRGLPKKGMKPLDKTYYFNGILYKEGEKWSNPYWDQENYSNIFLLQITYGKHTTKTGTAHQVMTDFINNWNKAKGEETLKSVFKKIKKTYNSK